MGLMRRRVSPALTAVLAILGFLLITAATSADATKKEEAPRKARLIGLIEERRAQVDAYDETVERLQGEVRTAREQAVRRQESDRSESERLARLAAEAGTTALTGRGIEVRLNDSDREPAETEDAGAYKVHDTDLQLVVNALFDAGAEAVAVNGSRIVATTPIRAAGDTIVVNFRPVTPPYRVIAIAADEGDFLASDIAKRFRRWTTLFGLGFSVREDDSLTVPAYTGRVAIVTASPKPEPPRAPGDRGARR